MRRAALVVALLAAALGGSRPAAQGGGSALLERTAERTQQLLPLHHTSSAPKRCTTGSAIQPAADWKRPTVFRADVLESAREERERVPHRSDTAIGRLAPARRIAPCAHPNTGSRSRLRFCLCHQSRYRLHHSDEGFGALRATAHSIFIETPPSACASIGINCFEAQGGSMGARLFDLISYTWRQIAIRLSNPSLFPCASTYRGRTAIRVERSETTSISPRLSFSNLTRWCCCPRSIETLTCSAARRS